MVHELQHTVNQTLFLKWPTAATSTDETTATSAVETAATNTDKTTATSTVETTATNADETAATGKKAATALIETIKASAAGLRCAEQPLHRNDLNHQGRSRTSSSSSARRGGISIVRLAVAGW